MKSVDFSKGIRGKYAKTDLRIVGSREEKQEMWVICLSNENVNLVQLKMYKVKFHLNASQVEVIDENGVPVACPKDKFLPVKLLGSVDISSEPNK